MIIIPKITSWKFIIKALFVSALAVAAIHVIAFSMFNFSSSMYNAVNFSGYAADGPFQIYNPLRRLAAGQVIGRDFQFFHGIGIPLLNYPLFRLLGRNIFASEFTRWIMSYASFLISAFFFFKVVLRKYKESLIATSIALLVTMPLADVIFPSNSLVGLRSTAPILFTTIYLLRIKKVFVIRNVRIELKSLIMGLMGAITILFGTEQGFALVTAYCFSELLIHRKSLKTACLKIAGFLVTTFASLLILFTGITRGHPLVPLKYLIDASKDQSWYFGTDPQKFLSWHTILRQLTTPFMLCVYALLASTFVLLLFIRKHNLIDLERRRVSIMLMLYGVLAFVVPAIGGYFSVGQSSTLMRVLVLILVSLILSLPIKKAGNKKSRPSRLAIRTLVVAGFIVYFIFTLFKSGVYVRDTKALHPLRLVRSSISAVNSNDYQVSSPGWKASLDSFSFALTGKDEVWSTYASLYESQMGKFQPSDQGHDYIIHALGKERRDNYENQFVSSAPKYAITLKQSYFPFEEWLWQRHWKMYRELLLGYSLTTKNASHLLWQRNAVPTNKENPWTTLKPVNNTAIIPEPTNKDRAVYEVKITYNASATLPFTSSLPKYLVKLEGSGNKYDISLPPHETTWEFPVSYFKESGAVNLKATTDGLFPGKLNILDIQYRELNVSEDNYKIFTEDYCYVYLADGGGVWRTTPVCKQFTASENL